MGCSLEEMRYLAFKGGEYITEASLNWKLYIRWDAWERISGL